MENGKFKYYRECPTCGAVTEIKAEEIPLLKAKPLLKDYPIAQRIEVDKEIELPLQPIQRAADKISQVNDGGGETGAEWR